MVRVLSTEKVSNTMKQDFFFLSPVLVMKVTNNNLDEVAEWCGGTVLETESRRVQGRMDKYVLVPTPKESKVSWAFPGMFVTKRLVITMQGKLKATWAVFRRDYFEKNYFESVEAAAAATWEREHDERNLVKEPVTVNVNVGEAIHEATLAKIQEIARQAGGHVTINVGPTQPFSHKEEIMTPGTEVSIPEAAIEEKEIPEVSVDDIPAGTPVFEHEHESEDACDIHDCQVERYADGVQKFTDKTFFCNEEKGAVEVDDEELQGFLKEAEQKRRAQIEAELADLQETESQSS